MLLSGSLDNSCKIWDAYNDRECKMTYNGHTAGVKEVIFDNDGKHFLSVSIDKTVKLWDTEKGTCLNSMCHGSNPLCASYYPDDNNTVLIGSANKKILQYDSRMATVYIFLYK